jgi:hypothetical protein
MVSFSKYGVLKKVLYYVRAGARSFFIKSFVGMNFALLVITKFRDICPVVFVTGGFP